MQYLRHLLNKARYSALPRLLTDALKRVGIVILPYHLYRRSVTATFRAPPDDSDVEFVELFAADMPTIAALPMVPGNVEFFEMLLEQGQRCFGLQNGGEILAFCWMDPNECHVHGAHFLLEKNEAYAHDIFTIPDARGHAIAPLLNAHFSAMMLELGIDTVYSVIDVFNRPSRRFATKIGCEPVRLVVYLRIFGLAERSFTLRVMSDGPEPA